MGWLKKLIDGIIAAGELTKAVKQGTRRDDPRDRKPTRPRPPKRDKS